MNERFRLTSVWVRGTILLFIVVFLGAMFQGLVVRTWPDGRTSGWSAAGSLASVITTVTAFAGLVGIAYVGRESKRARQQMRMELGPYLRVDLAPVAPGRGTFTTPEVKSEFQFDYAKFNPDDEAHLRHCSIRGSVPRPPSACGLRTNSTIHPGRPSTCGLT